MPGAEPPRTLIRRKLTPPQLSSRLAARERVTGLLTAVIRAHRVVCLYASAGAGKTTAVLQAAAQMPRPLAWLSVDTSDSATGRLLTYLEAALSRVQPSIGGVASRALAAHIPHAEVAGLLAESLEGSDVLVVLDDVERLATSPDALEVLSAFARYLPAEARLVLISRTTLSFTTAVGGSPWVVGVSEQDLALTVEEAAEVLALVGRHQVQAAEAVELTGGWLTGVLFEAWRADEHIIGLGGEADPLHGYLAAEILAALDPLDRDFLIRTSVLGEVSVAGAEALGLQPANPRLHSLQRGRLPVSWSHDGTVLRCHPRFREFLLKLLSLRDEDEQRELYRAHARALAAGHHVEEAVEEYLKVGCLEDALAIVHPVLESVIERTDFDLAERWLQQLAPVRRPDDLRLAGSELLLAVAREDYASGVALGDRLVRYGKRTELAASSGKAAALMAWCYLHAGRTADVDDVLANGQPGDEVEAARYTTLLFRDATESQPVQVGRLNGGPLDAMIMRTHFDLGRFDLLTQRPASPWAVRAGESWLTGALLVSGDVEQAYTLYHRLIETSEHSVWLSALLGPRLLAETADRTAAMAQLHEGRVRISATGSALFAVYSLLMEAEFALRAPAQLTTAQAALRRVRDHPIGREFAFVTEQWDMLTGLSLLIQGHDEQACAHLERAVNGMRGSDRLLFLAVAAVYLSEARWRTGADDAADEAADLALATAVRQGSNHWLLQALGEFPDVLTRRLDLERGEDSPWHELGRSLLVRGTPAVAPAAARVHVAEFGQAAVLVDGQPVRFRLSKSLELIAFLANSERAEASRQVVIDAIFAGRKSDSVSAYLRQAVLRLRETLPGILDTGSPPGTLRLTSAAYVTTDSKRLQSSLAQAGAMRGEQRLEALLGVLEVADRGEYLPGIDSPWAADRRVHLSEVLTQARCETAEVAFTYGRYRQAEELIDAVLATDRFQERAWRLQMRIAHLHGDGHRVLTSYRYCEGALRELGTRPSSTTVALLRDLRR